MDFEREIEYEDFDYIVAKTNYMVKNAKWVFQLIIPKVPVTKVPNFNFEYDVCDCSKHTNFTRGPTWKQILNHNKPIVFINTEKMFKEFEEAHKIELGYEKAGAAAFAQYFYQFYRDRFWNGEFTELIFFVKDQDVNDIFEHVNSGFTIPFCIPWNMDNEAWEKKWANDDEQQVSENINKQ